MPSNHIILCCPLLLLPSIFRSISIFSKESVLHIRCPKYWSFSFSWNWTLPMNTQDWFPLGSTGLTSMQSMDGILFSLKIEGNSEAFLISWIYFVVIMLGKISQIQKGKYLMAPVMWGTWSEVKSLSRVRLFATSWTVAYQDPQSMGFSREEYWSGLPFPSPGGLPDPGIEPWSPTM